MNEVELVAAHPQGIPEGPAAIHFCPVPGCLDIWESEATCVHAALIPDDGDPYDKVVFVQGHRHSEPVCAWPDCTTFLNRAQMAALPDAGRA